MADWLYFDDAYGRRRHHSYGIDEDYPSYVAGYSTPNFNGILPDKLGNRLYGEELVNLSKRTQHNIARLQSSLEPCNEYGHVHWHAGDNANGTKQDSNDDRHTYPSYTNPLWEQSTTFFSVGDWRKGMISENTETKVDNGFITPCTLCKTLDDHKQHLARRGLQLKAKQKKKVRIDYVAPPPITKKKEEDVEENKENLYRVVVKTGGKANAATSANVFITIQGRKGMMKKRQLAKKTCVTFTFGRNTKESFYLRGPHLGDLKYVTLEHDGTEQKHSWFVNEVEITDMHSGLIWAFVYNDWLSLYHGRGDVRVRLRGEQIERERREYQVTVVTGNLKFSGTDSRVFITLYGKDGVSPKLQLSYNDAGSSSEDDDYSSYRSKSGDYNRRMSVKNNVEDEQKRGKYHGIQKQNMDGKRKNHRVKFQDDLKNSKYSSDQNHKRYSNPEHGETRKQLRPSSARHRRTPEYDVSDRSDKRKQKARKSSVDQKAFERGNSDEFTLNVKDIGAITKIRIEHDNSGKTSPDWLLEKIEIIDVHSEDASALVFPCGSWISQDEEENPELFRILYPLNKSVRRKMNDETDDDCLRYDVIVLTGNKAYAGTDANVYVKFQGTLGWTSEKQLDDPKDNFERGRTDSFKIRCENVGQLKKIQIRHDNSGLGAGWFLDNVRVRRYFSKDEVTERLQNMAADMEEEVSKRIAELTDKPVSGRKISGKMKYKSSHANRDSEDNSRSRRKRHDSENKSDSYSDSDSERRERRERDYEKDGYLVKSSNKNKKEVKEKGFFEKLGDKIGKAFGGESSESEDEEKKDKYQEKDLRYRQKMSYKGYDQYYTDSEEETRGRKGKEKNRGHGGKKRYDSSDEERASRDERNRRHRSYPREQDHQHRRRSKHSDSECSDDSESGMSSTSDASGSERRKQNKTRKSFKRMKSFGNVKSSDEDDSDLFTKWEDDRIPFYDEYLFLCGKWFAKDEDDGQISRMLKPKSITTFYRSVNH